MAHHLAETIDLARKAKGTKKSLADEQAVDLILKIWGRRRDLPRGANPLYPVKDAIAVLGRLRPESWPYGMGGDSEAVRLLREAFDGLRVLVACSILVHTRTTDRVDAAEEAPFIGSDESEVLIRLNEWIDFVRDRRATGRAYEVAIQSDDGAEGEAVDDPTEIAEQGRGDDEPDWRADYAAQIDDLITTLQRLKGVLIAPDDLSSASQITPRGRPRR